MVKKVLITSALPYVNNVPHLGNIIGCVLSADVFARYMRSLGNDVLYVCGTDEHGTATETKAREEGLTPKEVCDKYHALHAKIYEWFNCSFDCFGRTSTEEHKKITQSMFLDVYKNGFIKKKSVEQVFCKECDKFLADRFVEGQCPFCNYEKARGDQCEGCGKLLDPTDLVKPRCKYHGEGIEIRESDHLFIDLPALSSKLKVWVYEQSVKGFWPSNALSFTNAWFKEGLKERCISRDLKWGVPIPLEGYENKVFYVWFDAPIGYISITASFRDDWKDWWQSDVKMYQFMAKDNIPFHTILFPASLIATGKPWNKLYHISSTEYLNYETGKFSKSSNVGVFGDNAIDSGIDSDVYRYYLLINRPENNDSEFTWKGFQERNNNELLANFGNFVNRALSFAHKNFDSKIPTKHSELFNLFRAEVNVAIDEFKGLMEEVKIRDGLKKIMHISKLGNQFFQEKEPWVLIKNDVDECGYVVYECLELVRKLAILIESYLPETSKKIFKMLNLREQKLVDIKEELDEGHKFNKPDTLFRKLEDKEIEELREKFAGGEDHLAKLNLKVFEIKAVEKHPTSDKLYVLNLEGKQIVAGLAEIYNAEELLGRKILVVSNLKPVEIQGVKSEGMLLGAESKKKQFGLLNVEDFGNVEGASGACEITLDDFKKAKLRVKDGVLQYSGKVLKINGKEITCDVNGRVC
jgi:methionyl-tRNA synthetase